MTTARCPACGASVLDGAPWCTLCYTDLRAPAVAPASVPEAVPTQPVAPPPPSTPAVAATGQAPSSTGIDLLDPLLDAPVAVAAHAARGPATWPCAACGASVELEQDVCTDCGTPFLAGADPVATLDIPLVGAIRPLAVSKSSKIWLVVGGGFAVCVLLMVFLSIVGMLL